MKNLLSRFYLNIKNKKSLSRKLFFTIVWMIASTVFFALAVRYIYLSVSIGQADAVILCSVIFLAVLSALVLYLVFNVFIPLFKYETLLFEQYLESKKETSKNVSFSEIIKTIIAHQQESWNRELTANYLRQKAELSQLQSQINPHFLYNTLESIRGFALMKDIPEIAQMTEALSLIFRNNIRNIGKIVSLENEITNVESYILIQQFRFGNRFTFTKQIESLQSGILQCKIPPLIIQPIVENAIYHGLETSLEREEIKLLAYLTEKRLIIKVSDNGCGIPADKLNAINQSLKSESDAASPNIYGHQNSIALTNIDQRIKMQYGNEYGIKIASTLNVGTEVEITLPCIWSA